MKTMSELKAAFVEFLNDNYDEVEVAGYTFEPARVLEELDPIAFREELLAYADHLEIDIDELEGDI